MSAVDLTGVTVRYRSTDTVAVHDVTLHIDPGEFCAIVGPSGCGKSTLLRLVAGLIRPSTGRIRLLGREVTGPRSDVGYVFQRPALLEWRTARRNILLQAEMRRIEAGDRADELIAMAGLTGFENAYPHELSGGMQQRVSLCRALLHRPPVLLMDEPFGALDALTREQLNVELRRIWHETGTTVLLVTHSVAEAAYLADRVVVMTPRPGAVAEQIAVGLPTRRDYAETVADPEFGRLTARIRTLLGGSPIGDHR